MNPPQPWKHPVLRRSFIPALLLGAAGMGIAALLAHDAHSKKPMGDRFTPIKHRLSPRLSAELGAAKLKLGSPLFIRIFKESSELEVWLQQPDTRKFKRFKTYEICTWSGHLGPKLKAGDRQAPEGFYSVNPGRMNPQSQFHLSFDIGYPNAYDRHYHRTGSLLMVHGNCVSIGCFAMTDPRIEEIYTLADAALAGGQPFFQVHCFPFRLTPERLRQAARSTKEEPWLPFWNNLKEGYERFENTKMPPDVTVKNGRYTFSSAPSP